nr:hypothetical protein [Tanacetum cinerariifolium]
MSDALRDIYRTLESRYVHEGRTIDTSFYNDLSDDSVAKFTAIGFDCLLALDDQIFPRNLKANMAEHPFDEQYKLVPRKMSSLKAKQPNKPPPKRTRNVGKSNRTQLSTSSSTESPPSDNGEFPSTKLSPRKTARMSVKYQNYVNLTSSSEEQPSERTPSPPPRKKSLSPPQAPSISISSKSTHYTSSSSL